MRSHLHKDLDTNVFRRTHEHLDVGFSIVPFLVRTSDFSFLDKLTFVIQTQWRLPHFTNGKLFNFYIFNETFEIFLSYERHDVVMTNVERLYQVLFRNDLVMYCMCAF